MPSIPLNLGELPDEELQEWYRKLAVLVSQTTNFYEVTGNAPLLAAVQAEIQRRGTAKLHDAIVEMQCAVDEFKTSSTKASQRLSQLTWWLLALTAALLGATVALIATGH